MAPRDARDPQGRRLFAGEPLGFRALLAGFIDIDSLAFTQWAVNTSDPKEAQMDDSQAVDVIKRGYAAFKSGNLQGFLDLCAPDIEWGDLAIKGLPHHIGPVRGRDAVAQAMQKLADNEDILQFEQHAFVGQGDRVFVEGTWHARAKPTGRTFQINYVHAFTVRAGKVQKYEGYWDTAAHAEAFRASN
jgi:uncharacterized protein